MITKRRNLLFLMTGQQRADTLGARQDGKEITPHLNALAEKSVTFRRAYTTTPLGLPATTALATGLYPTRNGVVYNDWACLRAGDHPPIHEFLSRLGYRIGHLGAFHVAVRPGLTRRAHLELSFGHEHYLRAASRFSQDIEEQTPCRDLQRQVFENIEGDLLRKLYYGPRARAGKASPAHCYDSQLVEQALRFLQAGSGRHPPWALFLWLAAPHPPLIVPRPWFDAFCPENLGLPENVGRTPRNEPPQRRKSVAAQLAHDVTHDQWRRVWSAYLGQTHWADHLLGKVLDFLSGSNLLSNTTIVYTSDHGDMLGQHDMYQKMEMYEPALRVPLMIFEPAVGISQVDSPVSHLDILPTLSELMGLGIEDDLDGISLVSCLRGSRGEENSAVHSQYSGNPGIGDLRRSVVTNRYKFIVDDHGGQELYDLQADPLEMNNLAGHSEHMQTLQTLCDQARQWGRTHGDLFGFKG